MAHQVLTDRNLGSDATSAVDRLEESMSATRASCAIILRPTSIASRLQRACPPPIPLRASRPPPTCGSIHASHNDLGKSLSLATVWKHRNRAMQKTKIAAAELAEMIRDGLAEEGHDVQVQPNPETGGTWRSSPHMRRRMPDQGRKRLQSGFGNATSCRHNIEGGSGCPLVWRIVTRHPDLTPGATRI
jgi:hypothetical protein